MEPSARRQSYAVSPLIVGHCRFASGTSLAQATDAGATSSRPGGLTSMSVRAALGMLKPAPHERASHDASRGSQRPLKAGKPNHEFRRPARIVVTAPTGESEGVLPTIVYGWGDRGRRLPNEKILPVMRAARAIGCLCKHNATLSAAVGGCLVETGVASAMAAALVVTADEANLLASRTRRH